VPKDSISQLYEKALSGIYLQLKNKISISTYKIPTPIDRRNEQTIIVYKYKSELKKEGSKIKKLRGDVE
jgi:hypothetical protein